MEILLAKLGGDRGGGWAKIGRKWGDFKEKLRKLRKRPGLIDRAASGGTDCKILVVAGKFGSVHRDGFAGNDYARALIVHGAQGELGVAQLVGGVQFEDLLIGEPPDVGNLFGVGRVSKADIVRVVGMIDDDDIGIIDVEPEADMPNTAEVEVTPAFFATFAGGRLLESFPLMKTPAGQVPFAVLGRNPFPVPIFLLGFFHQQEVTVTVDEDDAGFEIRPAVVLDLCLTFVAEGFGEFRCGPLLERLFRALGQIFCARHCFVGHSFVPLSG